MEFGKRSFGNAADGRIKGFHPLEVREISSVFASSSTDADLLNGARGWTNSYFDPRSAI